jgi:hypothetical protein
MTDAELRDEVNDEAYEIINWLDIEDRIERDIARAVSASRKGDVALWIAGLFAARVVGAYQVDATREIARQAGKSVSSVENWAHGYELYVEFREFGVASDSLRFVRKYLTLTHFSKLWELRRKYNLNLGDAYLYLFDMTRYASLGEPHSVVELEREVEAHERKDGKVTPWNYGIKSLIQHMTRLAVATDAPERVRQAAQVFAKVLDEVTA